VSAADKRFQSARARLALAGFVLMRSDPRDGEVRYLVERGGKVRLLRTLSDLEGLLAWGVAR
jgi:hypothetical protein